MISLSIMRSHPTCRLLTAKRHGWKRICVRLAYGVERSIVGIGVQLSPFDNVCEQSPSEKLHHAAGDPTLFERLIGLIHLLKRERAGDQFVDLELAVHVHVEQAGHVNTWPRRAVVRAL